MAVLVEKPYLAPRAPRPSGLSWQPSHPWTRGPLWQRWWTESPQTTGDTKLYSQKLKGMLFLNDRD